MNRFLRTIAIGACAGLLATTANSATDTREVDNLLHRADALVRMGMAEKGARRSFEEALALLDTATERLAAADISAEARRVHSFEIEAVREDLELLIELSDERFYGVFPLARLILPNLMAEEGFGLTEQLFHPPEMAAVEIATRGFLGKIGIQGHPYVVLRSSPPDRRLENVAAEVLLRDGRSTPILRPELAAALGAEDLEAFDRGEIDPQMVDRILAALDAVRLVVVTVGPSLEIDDRSVMIQLRGDSYLPGEVVQGSAVGASLVIRTESSVSLGIVRDRRDQFWPILGTQLLLLVAAMARAVRVRWSIDDPLKVFSRLVLGAILFFFGRAFIVVAVIFLRRIMPESSAMVAAAWWWPALLGLLAVLAGGLLAWIGQARLTDIMPGARGARAAGSIFALVALGASSYFVAPLLLLDGSRGFANLVPFVLASASLAVLFGLAARTGPPVPHYFMTGPLFLAPIVGVCLLMASPRLLWVMAGSTAVLCLAAWIRHRVALAHGTEEPELSAEEAAQADQQRLVKLSKKLSKKR